MGKWVHGRGLADLHHSSGRGYGAKHLSRRKLHLNNQTVGVNLELGLRAQSMDSQGPSFNLWLHYLLIHDLEQVENSEP